VGGLQGRSGRVRKISLPPGFNPQIVQPVASHYTCSDLKESESVMKVACFENFPRVKEFITKLSRNTAVLFLALVKKKKKKMT
jgi:hypothetical protein